MSASQAACSSAAPARRVRTVKSSRVFAVGVHTEKMQILGSSSADAKHNTHAPLDDLFPEAPSLSLANLPFSGGDFEEFTNAEDDLSDIECFQSTVALESEDFFDNFAVVESESDDVTSEPLQLHKKLAGGRGPHAWRMASISAVLGSAVLMPPTALRSRSRTISPTLPCSGQARLSPST